MELYDELKQILSTYMDNENIEIVDKYMTCAKKVYEGMKRKTGEDYINHSIRVAIILANLKMDYLTIGCALIHEAITLSAMSEEEITNEFGVDTSIILNSISKISSIKRTFTHSTNEAERYRRIIVGLCENPISLFIKLADRLDNLKTINVHSKEHILDIIDETENIFIPIAHRLGIKTMKSEMEDLCLRNKDPKFYNEILNKIDASKEELLTSLYKMRDEIIDLLNEHNISFDITYRVKSVRGIYNKLVKGKKWEQIFDLLGIRVLVNSLEECYLVVGLVHSKYRPIPKRFKDYIANPKSNLYQSLHTTVFGVDNRMYEIQIRTYEMNEIAEHGVASHWSYKEHTDGSKKTILESRLESFRTLIEVNDKEENVEFFSNLNNALTKAEIYVFTPKGDVIELPVDSTPIDFAYKIHSQVGNTSVGALVNGKMVSLDYKLQDGDIVELKTSKGQTPSKSWLQFVKTDTAKGRIKSYFFKQDREKSIVTGEELLFNEIKKRHLSKEDLLKEDIINKCLLDMKAINYEDLLIGIATFKYTPSQIVNKLDSILNPKEEEINDYIFKDIPQSNTQSKILVSGKSDILTTLAPCCTPVFGDDIIGFVTKGKGVLVHRKDCNKISTNKDRLIDVIWASNIIDTFTSRIRVNLDSSNENLINILTIASSNNIKVVGVEEVNSKDGSEHILSCKVKNKEDLIKFMNNIENLSFVNKVVR